MGTHGPLSLPDHLQTLLTSTLQTHSLSTWEMKEEGETSEVVYRLVFGKKQEQEEGKQVDRRIGDSGSYLRSQAATVGRPHRREDDSEVHHDSVGETKAGSRSSSSMAVGEIMEGLDPQGAKICCTVTIPSTATTKDAQSEIQVAPHLACVADYEDHCKRTMSGSAWPYFSGGAMTGATVRRNKDAFKNILITPRQLVNVFHPDLTYSIRSTGETVPLPIGIAPTAFHSWVTPKGELATVGATREAGIVYVSSLLATTKLEDIAEAEPQAIRWQQHKIFKDRSFTEDVVRRAEKAGVTAMVLTIDKPKLSNAIKYPDQIWMANFSGTVKDFIHIEKQVCPDPTWDDVRWFCELTSLPVIIKGIMTSESARMAVQVGAKGVIVSNHGGRTLDSLPATMEVLRDVVEAVGEQLEVFVDGGIMTGLDVFKALAYGARMVFIGRSAIWGLAHGGQAGLCHVIDILKEELVNVMKLAGTPTLGDITMDRIYKSH